MTRPKVVMYIASWCPYCALARQLLHSKGIELEEVDIEALPEARTEMMARSGRRTVPQIFIGAVHVGGADELHALDADGRLDQLLNTGAT